MLIFCKKCFRNHAEAAVLFSEPKRQKLDGDWQTGAGPTICTCPGLHAACPPQAVFDRKHPTALTSGWTESGLIRLPTLLAAAAQVRALPVAPRRS